MSISDVNLTLHENVCSVSLASFNSKMYATYHTKHPTIDWTYVLHLAEITDGSSFTDKKTYNVSHWAGSAGMVGVNLYSKLLAYNNHLTMAYPDYYNNVVHHYEKKYDTSLALLESSQIGISSPGFWGSGKGAKTWAMFDQFDDRHVVYGTDNAYDGGACFYRRKEEDRIYIEPPWPDETDQYSHGCAIPHVSLYDDNFFRFAVTHTWEDQEIGEGYKDLWMVKVDRFGTLTYEEVNKSDGVDAAGLVVLKNGNAVVAGSAGSSTYVYEQNGSTWNRTIFSNAYHPFIFKDSIDRVYVVYLRKHQQTGSPYYWYTDLYVRVKDCGVWRDEIKIFDGETENYDPSEYETYFGYAPTSVGVLPLSTTLDRVCIALNNLSSQRYAYICCFKIFHPVLSGMLTISQKKFSELSGSFFVPGHSDLLNALLLRRYGHVLPDLSGNILLRRYAFTEPPLHGSLTLWRQWWKELPSSLWVGLMYNNLPQKLYIGKGQITTLEARVNVYPIGKRIVEKLLNRLTTPYDKSIDSMNATFLKMDGRQIAELEININNKIIQSYVDTAEDVNLDRIGALFGLERLPGEEDDEFRVRIKSAVPSLVGGGTLAEIKRATTIVTGSADPRVIENFPAHIAVLARKHPDEFSISTLHSMINTARAAGVKLDYVGTEFDETHTVTAGMIMETSDGLGGTLVVRKSNTKDLSSSAELLHYKNFSQILVVTTP
ncbi:MAG: hypothetical protein N2V78_09020 [Methanophagales archaeon]|nr:hypothetical protein [Methanophagales archaeon]